MIRCASIFSVLALVFAAFPAFAQESGWIGVSIEDQKDRGAVIRSVENNSPAEKAGLKAGDVIVEYNKQDVLGVQQLTRLVRETPVGRTIEMKVRRDNRDQTIHVTTDKLPTAFDRLGRLDNLNVQLPDFRAARDRVRVMPRIQMSTTYIQSGIRVEQLTDQLRDYFGASNGGVLVSSVDKDSSADKAGLKAGDVITSIGGKSVRTPSDFSRELRAAGTKPALKVIRGKQEREIKIE